MRVFTRALVFPHLRVKGDIVAIKGTLFGPGQKYAAAYLGPYKITEVKDNDSRGGEWRSHSEDIYSGFHMNFFSRCKGQQYRAVRDSNPIRERAHSSPTSH